MPLAWKRFFLMIVGVWLVFAGGSSWAGPLKPANNEERVVMVLTSVALAALGFWMIFRGYRMRPPLESSSND